MAKYRKKPLVIEAIRFDGLNYGEIVEFMGDADVEMAITVQSRDLTIKTLEGDMLADEGDWIIKGIAGEFYPCKPGIFDATYEPVEETDGR